MLYGRNWANIIKIPPRIAGGIFIWCRKWDSFGDTGAVSPPARGTQKVFTGYFLPFGTFPSRPAYLLSTSKKESVAEHELRIWCS